MRESRPMTFGTDRTPPPADLPPPAGFSVSPSQRIRWQEAGAARLMELLFGGRFLEPGPGRISKRRLGKKLRACWQSSDRKDLEESRSI
jgi:hypothetical protein